MLELRGENSNMVLQISSAVDHIGGHEKVNIVMLKLMQEIKVMVECKCEKYEYFGSHACKSIYLWMERIVGSFS